MFVVRFLMISIALTACAAVVALWMGASALMAFAVAGGTMVAAQMIVLGYVVIAAARNARHRQQADSAAPDAPVRPPSPQAEPYLAILPK